MTRAQMCPGTEVQWGTALDTEAVCEYLDIVQTAADIIRESMPVFISDVAHLSGVHYGRAALVLRDLARHGHLEVEGFGGRTVYRVAPRESF